MSRQVAEHYDDATIINTAVLYASSGNYSKVARQTNIPRDTIVSWSKDREIWVTAVTKAQREISDEILAANLALVIASNEQIADRIAHGDTVLDKHGEHVKIPMKGRDLAVVAGIKEDKARVALGLATSVVGRAESKEELLKKFAQIAQDYNKNVVSEQ